MRTACLLLASWAVSGCLLCLAGCTAKSTKRVVGSTSHLTEGWQTGDALVIDSINGRVQVSRGSGDAVVADFTPFVLIGYDATDEEEKQELEKLKPSLIRQDGERPTLIARTVRDGQVLSSLGADIDLSLPEAFDGSLEIRQNNGPIEVSSVGRASELIVNSENGSCEVSTGSASVVDVYCDSGSLYGSIGDIPADFASASLRTGRGNIQLVFPPGGVFVVQALSRSGGLVDVGTAEAAGCTVEAASDSSKTISCNGGTSEDPLYEVIADDDDGAQLMHDIELEF